MSKNNIPAKGLLRGDFLERVFENLIAYTIFIMAFLIGFFLVLYPFRINAQELKFNTYDDLLEYTEDFDKNEVIYRFKNGVVSQFIEDNWSEEISKRKDDRIYLQNTETGERKMKIFSGDNFYNDSGTWFQVDYGTTTIMNFGNELSKMTDKDYWSKLVDLVKIPISFALSTTTYAGSVDGTCWMPWSGSSWSTIRNTASSTSFDYTSTAVYSPVDARWRSNNGGEYMDNRSVFNFNTTIYETDPITIDSVSFYFFIHSNGSHNRDLIIASSTFDTDVLDGRNFGKTDFTALSDPVAHNNSLSKYYEFAWTNLNYLNQDGYTKIILHEYDYDYLDVTPPGVAGYVGYGYYSEEGGTSKDPYLEINYTIDELQSPGTSTITQVPCDLPWINDVSIITGCHEIYNDSTSSPDEVRYSYFRIPLVVYIIFVFFFLFIGNRLLLEFIIRWRN